MSYQRVASLKNAGAFRQYLQSCGARLEFDDVLEPPDTSPLARPFEMDGIRTGNRFAHGPREQEALRDASLRPARDDDV